MRETAFVWFYHAALLLLVVVITTLIVSCTGPRPSIDTGFAIIETELADGTRCAVAVDHRGIGISCYWTERLLEDR